MGRATARRVLVTGATGALGAALVARLSAAGDEVTAWGRTPAPFALPARYEQVDLAAIEAVRSALDRCVPDVVVHLAGTRSASAVEAVAVNVGAFATLAEGLSRSRLAPLVLVAGSSAQYGLRTSPEPIAEDSRLDASGWYGASKSAQEAMALAAARSCLFPAVAVRLFNLVGPHQRKGLLFADVAAQVVDPCCQAVEVGSLDGIRDFVDYRDAAQALELLTRTGASGIAVNVASGHGTRVRDAVHMLVAAYGRADLPVHERGNPTSPAGAPTDQVGDPSLLRRLTGWAPETPLRTSLADTIEWWSHRHAAAGRG